MDKKYIALTFDDGPSADTTASILDILEKYSIPATFFVCAHSVSEQTAPVMRRAFDMGCEIANHSADHPAFTDLTPEEMRSQVETTSAVVEGITGVRPRFFRPPFISVDDVVMQTVDMPFICGIGTEDWSEECSAERRYTDIMAQVCDGAIILMHDFAGNAKTVEAVGRIVPTLLALGYSFVTVSDLFAVKGVNPEEKPYVYSVVPQSDVFYREKWYESYDDCDEKAIISICGDNCSCCPRYTASTQEELEALAVLWHKIGWRKEIVPAEQMRCSGCGSQKGCTYGLRECAEGHGVQNCTECERFPCEKIQSLLSRSAGYQKLCVEVCTADEYRSIHRAFFMKEKYLGLEQKKF